MYIVIGASGYFGRYFLKNLESRDVIATFNNSSLSPTSTDKIKWTPLQLEFDQSINNFLDLINSYLEKKKVIFLAASHHPKFVEENPRDAYKVNITALESILSRIKNVHSFVYASTDNVYGACEDLSVRLDESSPTFPLNEYGKQKLSAEKLVTDYGYNVIRYSLLMGPSLIENKKHFFDNILDAARKKMTMDLIRDSYRTPVDFNQASLFTLQLISQNLLQGNQIINVAGDEIHSKYSLGVEVCRRNNILYKSLREIDFSSFTDFSSNRAQNILISNSKLKKLLKLEKINIELTK